MQYIGVCSLLARITNRGPIRRELYADDISSIERALKDAAKAMPGRFEVGRVGGGLSLEPIMHPPTETCGT